MLPESIRKPVISAFIMLIIIVSFLWLMAPFSRRNQMLRPIEPAVLYLGLWRSYDVFSPDPRKVNLHLEALVTFDDGSQIVYPYPRLDKLGIIDRVLKERYRKFGHDHLNWEKEKILWPDFARFIARQTNTSSKHPRTVTLVRHFAYIPPPEEGMGKPLPEHRSEYRFFSYDVKEEDLK